MSHIQLIAACGIPAFIGYSNTFTSSGSITAPSGATKVTISMTSDAGDGGAGFTCLGEYYGGGGGGGAAVAALDDYSVVGGTTTFTFSISDGVTLTSPSMSVTAGSNGGDATEYGLGCGGGIGSGVNPGIGGPGGTWSGGVGVYGTDGTAGADGTAGYPGTDGVGGSPGGGNAPGGTGTKGHSISFTWS